MPAPLLQGWPFFEKEWQGGAQDPLMLSIHRYLPSASSLQTPLWARGLQLGTKSGQGVRGRGTGRRRPPWSLLPCCLPWGFLWPEGQEAWEGVSSLSPHQLLLLRDPREPGAERAARNLEAQGHVRSSYVGPLCPSGPASPPCSGSRTLTSTACINCAPAPGFPAGSANKGRQPSLESMVLLPSLHAAGLAVPYPTALVTRPPTAPHSAFQKPHLHLPLKT